MSINNFITVKLVQGRVQNLPLAWGGYQDSQFPQLSINGHDIC